jgi:hypothetical protein
MGRAKRSPSKAKASGSFLKNRTKKLLSVGVSPAASAPENQKRREKHLLHAAASALSR